MTSEDAKKALLKLFQCYNLSGNDFERSLKFEAYWEVLSGLVADAVVAVCRRACRGEIGQPGFLPTAGELYRAAISTVLRPTKRPVTNLLYEYIPSPEERAMVVKLFNDCRSELAAGCGDSGVSGWERLGQATYRAMRLPE